jgi:hypothetical protein
MSRSNSQWAMTVVVSILFVQLGCDGGTPGPQTPGRYFRQKQASTMTPNGKIRSASVKEVGDKIEYQTEDGKRWRVRYSRRADGTYEYQTPEAVK